MKASPTGDPAADRGSAREVFLAFLKLGVTSFGGPIAHLGYFREEFVRRRRWLSDSAYADLVALCQFLPGPASSQAAFALGLFRAGPMGALASWLAFTAPSAIFMLLFAFGAFALAGPVGAGMLHGLKIVAVAVVGQAVWGMAHTLAPDRPRAGIALAAAVLVLTLPGASGQIGAIATGALAGAVLCREAATAAPARLLASFLPRRAGLVVLALFLLLLFLLPVLAAVWPSRELAILNGFYRAGSLVFGGGHVVLPLLEAVTVDSGWIGADDFLAGYGAAQAVPGPLFTFAAYLGAMAMPGGPGAATGAVVGLIAIFLPGFLLLVGALPFWDALRARPSAQAVMRGANAAVVGILAAALYDPVWTSAIRTPHHFALAMTGFVLLTAFRCPPWIVVILLAAGGALPALVPA